MKKLSLFALLLFGLILLGACNENDKEEPINYVLAISDITLTKGETITINHTLTPAAFAQVSFEVVSQTPSNTVSIVGNTLSALEVGTASIKATATNMPGASVTFSVDKTFNVTVEPIPVVDGQFILNGGFEFGLNEWTVVSLYDDQAYGTQVVDNYPHSGDAALNLWYDNNEDGLGDPLDLKLSQTLQNVPTGTYLFSLWYQGTTTSITLRVLEGEVVLATETFSGYDFQPVPENNGYVNYGLELTLASTKTLTVEIIVVGPEEVWGYIDDVSFQLGTLDDLEVVPSSGEEGFTNFITGGAFNSLAPWTVSVTGPATNKTASLSSGRLSIWADGQATYRISQMVELIDETYNLAIYFNGGELGTEFNVDEAYIYVLQGETLHKVNLTPEGWGSGEMKRIELSDVALNGTVEVGIYINFIGGGNNWINLDNFVLWSYNIAISEADLAAAEAVTNLINSLPSVMDLTLEDEADVVAAREAYEALTALQKSFVQHLDILVALEAALEDLAFGQVIAQFNAVGNFTSPDWSLSAIGWTALGGSLWTRDNWPHTGAQNYDMFHNSSALQGSITKTVSGLSAGNYRFSIYLAGGDLTSITLFADESENLTTITGAYAKYSLDFTVLEGESVDLGVRVVRPSTSGWISIDTASLEVVLPSALDVFNTYYDFTSPDWSLAAMGWTVVGGSAWTRDNWAMTGTQNYDMFNNVTVLEASITKTAYDLPAGTYAFRVYAAGGDLGVVSIHLGDSVQEITLTGSYAAYDVIHNHLGGDVVVKIEVTRPSTSGWVNFDAAYILNAGA